MSGEKPSVVTLDIGAEFNTSTFTAKDTKTDNPVTSTPAANTVANNPKKSSLDQPADTHTKGGRMSVINENQLKNAMEKDQEEPTHDSEQEVKPGRWIDELKNVNIYGRFTVLVNEIYIFHKNFPKPKFAAAFQKLALSLEELLRVINKTEPPSDVMVATISGVMQTQLEELRILKSGRQNHLEYAKHMGACGKNLVSFINELQQGIRTYEMDKRNSTCLAPECLYEGCSEGDIFFMKKIVTAISHIKDTRAKCKVQSYMLENIQLHTRRRSSVTNRNLVHTDTPEILRGKIESLHDINDARFECSFSSLRRNFGRTLAHSPVMSISGIVLMTAALGYTIQSLLVRFDQSADPTGVFVIVFVPTMLAFVGFCLFTWAWIFGQGGKLAKYAYCDFGTGSCCGICSESSGT
mmetsp:Transcript_22512/g.39801  ORF Transcript_22512/g.39801 Transcript_22512/m.39801 type:complete len:409 (-) Transcript_22512:271-1497(-)